MVEHFGRQVAVVQPGLRVGDRNLRTDGSKDLLKEMGSPTAAIALAKSLFHC